MDPPHKSKKQPKSTPFTTITAVAAKPHHHPPDPDPTIAAPSIHTISKHFAKLYTNHHKVLSTSKPSNPLSKPQINTNLQAKAMAISAIEDTTNKPIITKSIPQHTKTLVEIEKDKLRASITGVIPKKSHEDCDIKTDKIKKLPKKGRAKKESHEGRYVKRAFDSLSRSQDSGILKEAYKGYDGKKTSFSLGGRSKSFRSPQIELADFFICNGVKVVSVDMPPFMQAHAVDSARKAHDSLEKFTSKALALTLKKEFDGVYGPAWHCIVGTNFGSFVTHSVGGFLYFSMDNKLYILLFKTTVQRAD
ncbi:dynein light chain type 1 family protein [Actinidia rufa]|uniref:Dynein light chain type 1 family protein n=1 Tax=Actinidia rufa TaxID=165716 RepID=A0A7J0GAF2_9ERIC|nr:dynein light chain type 1 family protein [Actinidia rufa]